MSIETYKKLQLFMDDFIKEVEPDAKMHDMVYEIGGDDIIKVSIIREYNDDFKEALITEALMSMEYDSTVGKGYKFFNFLGQALISGIREDDGMMCVDITIKLYSNFLSILESETADIVDRIMNAKTVIVDKFVNEYAELLIDDLINNDISLPIKHISNTNLIVVSPMVGDLSDYTPETVAMYFPSIVVTNVASGHNDTIGDIADVYAVTFGELFWSYMTKHYDLEDVDNLQNNYEDVI